jgi:hypothetical protein
MLFSLLVFLMSVNIIAQKNVSLKTRKAQVTFAYPIGSNEMSSAKE